MKINTMYSGNTDSNFLMVVFKDGFNLLRKYDNLIVSIENYLEDPSSYTTDEGIIFLDIVGDLIELDVEHLTTFHINSISGYQDLKRRLSDGFENYYKLIDLLTPDYDAFLPIELSNLKEALRLAKNSYGHFALFLVRQFEMDDLTEENFESNVEFSLENACKDLGISGAFNVLSLRDLLNEKVKEYKPRIEIFDEYPDLEDKFFNKVGTEFYDLDYLTYEDVINVIEEKLDPEDLKRKLNEASGNIQESAD